MNSTVKSQTDDKFKFRARSLSPMIGLASRTPFSQRRSRINPLSNSQLASKIPNLNISDIRVSSNDSKQAEEPKSDLFQKLALLENLHCSDLLRIEQLERQVKDLLSQLTAMKNTNRSLLGDQKVLEGGEVHALYQDLFITDMKQQMVDLSNDMCRFRTQKEVMKKEFENIKKENAQLHATVKRYRIMLANTLKKNHNLDPIGENSSAISGLVNEFEKTPKKTNENLRFRASLETKTPSLMKISSISMNKLEKINLVLIQLMNCSDFNSLCKILTRAAKTLTKSSKVTVYIVSPKAQDYYVKSFSGSSDFIGKVRFGNDWIFIHTHKEAFQEEPLFKKIEDLRFPIRHPDYLIVPVMHDHEVSLVVQCQGKEISNQKVSSIFALADELVLKLLASIACLKIESLVAVDQEKSEIRHSAQIADVAGKIVSCLTHRDIANRVRKVLPGYFDFENAGVVFLDTKSNQFFVMIHDPNTDDYFGNTVIRFPFGIGLTGQAISQEGVTVFRNPKSLQYYNPEIDNVGWAHETKSIMMGCLRDWNGNLVGVIQFTNKKYGEVNAKDIKRLESLLEMLGACIAATNLAVEHFELTIRFKETMEKIIGLVNDNEKNQKNNDFKQVLNRVKNLKDLFGEWAENRKTEKIS